METATAEWEMKSLADEALRALESEKGSRAKDRKAYEDQVVRLRKEVYESLQQTHKRVYGAFEQET